jgi:ribosome production factor 1
MAFNNYILTRDTVLITTGLDSTLHNVAHTFEGIIPNSKYVRRSAHKYVSTGEHDFRYKIVAKMNTCRHINTAFVKYQNSLKIEGTRRSS